MCSGVSCFVVLFTLGQLVTEFFDNAVGLIELSVCGEPTIFHGIGEVVVDILLRNLKAAFKGRCEIAVRAEGSDDGADTFEGCAFLLLACRNILRDELDLSDGAGAVPVALAEVFAGLLFIWSGETVGTGRAVLSGEEDFVGVHIGYFLRFTFPVFLPYFLGVA